jgi:hypothetical protein
LYRQAIDSYSVGVSSIHKSRFTAGLALGVALAQLWPSPPVFSTVTLVLFRAPQNLREALKVADVLMESLGELRMRPPRIVSRVSTVM